MTTDEVKEAIDVLRKMRVVDLVFSGGNPLLREDIGEILRYAHDKFPLVSIYDNGSLAARKLDALRHADRVCISLSTLNPELQNLMCGVPNAFQDATKSISVLKREGIGVVVSIMVSNVNMEEVQPMVEHFGEMGVPVTFSLHSEVAFQDSMVKIGVPDKFLQLQPGPRLVNLITTIRLLKKKYPVHLDLKTMDAVEQLFSSNLRSWRCNALASFFTIDESGNVSGCHVTPPVCKVLELPEIWETEKAESLRMSYSICEKCTYLCYVSYSMLRRISDLVEYCWDYEHYVLGKLFRTRKSRARGLSAT